MSKDKGFHIIVTLADDADFVQHRFTVVHPANTLTRAVAAVREHIESKFKVIDEEDMP